MSPSARGGGEQERLNMAASWHARLEGGPAAEGDWEAFTAWLEVDPLNRLAFDAVDAAAIEAVAASRHSDFSFPARAPQRRLATRALLGFAGLAAAVLVAVIARPDVFLPAERDVIATASGERREVSLADGSTVHLNTNSQLAAMIGRRSRRVQIEQGEAMFEVAPDTTRPFQVAAGDQTVTVVGTAFNVMRHAGRITVSVERGQVDVESPGTRGKVRLGVGDQYTARDGAPGYELAKIDPAIASAWRDGRAVFTDATLSQVASDLSRYYTRPIVVRDPVVASLRFSGILKVEDQMATLRRLETLLPIAVADGGDEVRLERGTSK